MNELYWSWKTNLKSNIIMLLLGITGIISIGVAIVLNLDTEVQAEKFNEIYEDVQFYTIMDNFFGDAENEITDINNSNKFSKFLSLLNSSNYFDYFMMYEQPVYIENYIGKESNIYGYEYSSDLSKNHQLITEVVRLLKILTKLFKIGILGHVEESAYRIDEEWIPLFLSGKPS